MRLKPFIEQQLSDPAGQRTALPTGAQVLARLSTLLYCGAVDWTGLSGSSIPSPITEMTIRAQNVEL